MKIAYKGKDISGSVTVRNCAIRDVSCQRADSADIVFEHPEAWDAWGPQMGDEMEISMGGFSTGRLFVTAMQPEGSGFRIIATALPQKAKGMGWMSFVGKSFTQIVRECAARSGMDWTVNGVEDYAYEYLESRMEGCAAFLERLCRMEGAVLKTCMGRYNVIGIKFAQDRKAYRCLEIKSGQPGVTYTDMAGEKLARAVIKTPFAETTATDSDVTGANSRSFDMPARDQMQAARWARGLLLDHNRRRETLTVETEFDPGLTAMERVDVTGGSKADGAWIIDEAVHDIINGKSTVTMFRCIGSIR